LDGSSITWVPEVEGTEPCKWFGAGKCPGCYSFKLWRVRKRNPDSKQKTPARGLVRLGTYIEITWAHWLKFKRLMPERRYFLVTRGLEEEEFYRAVEADPYCLNIQVSTDILKTARGSEVVPGEDRLRWFLVNVSKAIFRFKTQAEASHDSVTGLDLLPNVADFSALRTRLSIPPARVMETPLRLPKVPHVLHSITPLEKSGWDTRTFLRCNSACDDCSKENGFMACAAVSKVLERLEAISPAQPVRATPDQIRAVEEGGRIEWGDLVTQALRQLGGRARVAHLYKQVLQMRPEVEQAFYGDAWKFKVRQAVQRVAQLDRGTGEWFIPGAQQTTLTGTEGATPW
jgi:hypothetical protein